VQNIENTQEIQTVTVMDKIYKVEDLSNDSKNLINDITLIQNINKDKNTEIAINNIAIESLMIKLVESTKDLTPVQVKTEEVK
jgi:hypothetical protein